MIAAAAVVAALATAAPRPVATASPPGARSGPRRFVPGPLDDLEVGTLIAELGEATDTPSTLRDAVRSGFAERAFDVLDAAAGAAGDASLFAAARLAFSGDGAFAALQKAGVDYLGRLPRTRMRVTVLGELARQIRYNAATTRDGTADTQQRATLFAIDDADDVDLRIAPARRALALLPDGAWNAIRIRADAFESLVVALVAPLHPPHDPAVDVAPVLVPVTPAPNVPRRGPRADP